MPKVPTNEANLMKCMCPGCPTWQADGCPKDKLERLYCGVGKSDCDLVERGCICGTCPVWAEYGLSKGYFCLSGTAE